jgi:hypothetical protein
LHGPAAIILDGDFRLAGRGWAMTNRASPSRHKMSLGLARNGVSGDSDLCFIDFRQIFFR